MPLAAIVRYFAPTSRSTAYSHDANSPCFAKRPARRRAPLLEHGERAGVRDAGDRGVDEAAGPPRLVAERQDGRQLGGVGGLRKERHERGELGLDHLGERLAKCQHLGGGRAHQERGQRGSLGVVADLGAEAVEVGDQVLDPCHRHLRGTQTGQQRGVVLTRPEGAHLLRREPTGHQAAEHGGGDVDDVGELECGELPLEEHSA